MSGVNFSYNNSFGGLGRRNTFGGNDNQPRPSLRGRRQIYLASTPIPAGDLRLRALQNQGFNSPASTGPNASAAMSPVNPSNSIWRPDNKSSPVDSRPTPISQVSMGDERYCREYLFGGASERNAARAKTDAENDQGRRKVSFSPDLPRRELTERTPSHFRFFDQTTEVFTPRRLNDASKKDITVEPNSPARNGPPLRFLRDNRPPVKRPRIDVTLPEQRVVDDPDEEDFWITVYGFPPSQQERILELFGRHGTIVKHDVPRPGNWIIIRYSTIVHVQQALERNGHLLIPGIMIGVVPTRSMSKIVPPENDECAYQETLSGAESSRLIPDGNLSSLSFRPSVSDNSSSLPIGMRNIGYNFHSLEEESTTRSPGFMDRFLSVFK